ncbi:MAG TPA: MFS transporter [Polyangiaceae bacterium]|jgi:MFS family permease|nr:MFS transporter [Polyangiaceae bacterium]
MRARGLGLPSTVVLLGITSLFTDVATEMIFPLLPVLIAAIGGSATYLGLIEGLADTTASFLKLASGYLGERPTWRKPLVVGGYAIATVVRPFVALATAPWHVLVVRISDRIGKGLRSSPRDAMIAASVSRHDAGRAFGFHNAMDHAGAVIGPVTATLLLSRGVPLRTVFWIAALPGFFALLAVFLTPNSPHAPDPSPGPEPTPSSNPAPAARALPRALKSYCVILAVFALGASSDAFLILRAGNVGVPTALLPLLWTFFNASKLVSSYWGGSLSDRMPRAWLIVLGWFVYALCYLGFALAEAPWHVWALFAVYGTYYGLTEPVEKALVRDITSPAERARAYGVYNFVVGACTLPAGLLTGFLWQEKSPAFALATGAILAGVAALGLVIWARTSGTLSNAT